MHRNTRQEVSRNAAEIGMLAHLYRGEMYRSKIWRPRLDATTTRSSSLPRNGSDDKICFPRLQAALVSLVCAVAFLSGCGTPYASLGGFSETKIAPATYRVSFSPYGYIPWDLAYQVGLLRCATLTMQNGYRYFGVLAIENYGSGNSFSLPGKSYTYGTANDGGFYNANTAYNPPQSFSIIWPQPVLTIRMLKDPIPGVTLDAGIIRNRGMTEIRK